MGVVEKRAREGVLLGVMAGRKEWPEGNLGLVEKKAREGVIMGGL